MLHKVCVKISVFIGKHIGVRNEIKVLSSIFVLQFNIVIAKSVFPGYFIAGGEVVDLLVLIESFVEVRLARRRGPKDVPLVRFRMFEAIYLEQRPD